MVADRVVMVGLVDLEALAVDLEDQVGLAAMVDQVDPAAEEDQVLVDQEVTAVLDQAAQDQVVVLDQAVALDQVAQATADKAALPTATVKTSWITSKQA